MLEQLRELLDAHRFEEFAQMDSGQEIPFVLQHDWDALDDDDIDDVDAVMRQPSLGCGQDRCASLARRAVHAKPRRELCFTEFSGGKGHNSADYIFFIGSDRQSIDREKNVHGLERDSFVTVYERVVPGDSEAIRRGQRHQIRLGLVMKLVTRPIECRLQQAHVAHTRSPAVVSNLIDVDREDDVCGKPTRLIHFASSRIAFRYFLAPSS